MYLAGFSPSGSSLVPALPHRLPPPNKCQASPPSTMNQFIESLLIQRPLKQEHAGAAVRNDKNPGCRYYGIVCHDPPPSGKRAARLHHSTFDCGAASGDTCLARTTNRLGAFPI